MPDLHGIPDARGLVIAVRDFLESDVMSATQGRVQFHARVAVNVLGMVERELAHRSQQEADYTSGLAHLGYADEAELARAIREGAVKEGRLDDVVAFVEQTVRARLAVANPRYMNVGDEP